MLLQLTQYGDISFLILRMAIAAIFAYHALPKLMGAKMMATAMGAPAAMVLMIGTIEMFSAVGMLLGIYIQIAALLLSIIMIGAILMKITKWGSPFTAMDKTGWEFDMILLAANIVIIVNGGGALILK